MATATETNKVGVGFDEGELPDGFVPLSQRQVDGWFALEPKNKVQGHVLAKVSTKSNFKDQEDKMFVKIELTNGTTKAFNGDKKPVMLQKGMVVGVDVKGYLKGLRNVGEGQEVIIKYLGKEAKAKKAGMSPAHLFAVAVLEA